MADLDRDWFMSAIFSQWYVCVSIRSTDLSDLPLLLKPPIMYKWSPAPAVVPPERFLEIEEEGRGDVAAAVVALALVLKVVVVIALISSS